MMKLAAPRNDVFLNNPTAVHECTLATGPKMFEMLIRQYGDPILAMIRELSTNAADSHLEVGKDDVPFVITLEGPGESHLTEQSMLRIRDFGAGMDHEKMTKLYTNVGESDKTNSDKPTGCLGIGSKSPLAYADQFFVECFDGEHVRMYCVTRDEVGKILLLEQGEFASDEPRGVRFSIPLEASDVSTVRSTALRTLRHFGHPNAPYRVNPEFVGFGYENPPTPVSEQLFRINEVAYAFKADANIRDSCVLMGGIRYPLPVEDLLRSTNQRFKADDDEIVIKAHPVALCVPLGDENGQPYLTFPPSRDAIEMTPRSREYLSTQLRLAAKHFVKQLQDKVDAQPSWLQCGIWATNQSAVKLPLLLKRTNYQGGTIPADANDLLKIARNKYPALWGISTYEDRDHRDSSWSRARDHQRVFSDMARSLSEIERSGVVLVDKPGSYRARVAAAKGNNTPYLMLRDAPSVPGDTELDDPWLLAEQALDELGIPHYRVSSLPKYSAPRQKREKRIEEAIFFRVAPFRAHAVSEQFSPVTKPEGIVPIVRMKAWETYLGETPLADGTLLRLRSVLTDAHSQADEAQPHAKCLCGLRHTDWQQKQLPEGCVPAEQLIRREASFWRPWYPVLKFAKSVEDSWAVRRLSVWEDGIKSAKLRAPTRKFIDRLLSWAKWSEAAQDLRNYLSDLYYLPGMADKPDTGTLLKKYDVEGLDDAVNARFSLLNLIPAYGSKAKDVQRSVALYLEAADRTGEGAPLKPSLLPTLPKLPMRSSVEELAALPPWA